mmetsp:Transcript_9774/g.16016  ORF Transcript_9774/g.16016 Transcript_9774/m.16016 type:complete len:94 (-) Transcript_9774:70-351(-)
MGRLVKHAIMKDVPTLLLEGGFAYDMAVVLRVEVLLMSSRKKKKKWRILRMRQKKKMTKVARHIIININININQFDIPVGELSTSSCFQFRSV